jgi:hypothetical protein
MLMQLTEKMSPETDSPPGLTAFHCAQIGLFALYRGEYFHLAIEWIETAIDKVFYEYDQSIPLAVLENYLELAVKAVCHICLCSSFQLFNNEQ